MSDLSGQNILLGISAGIAAYKTPMLVRGLTTLGANVQVVLSDNAHHFVTATTLQAVSGNLVRGSLWDEQAEAAMGHIELARWADQILIAPATANCIARLAAGSASDLLSTLCLATTAPITIAPSMNQQMFAHPGVQANLATLRDYGYQIVGPDSGDQACGDDGPGRMTEPDDLVDAIINTSKPLASSAPTSQDAFLAGQHILITSGPTREAIDPVRYISNHSSGLQGTAIAEAALAAGATVTLIAGPGVPDCGSGIQRIDVVSTQNMYDAVHQHIKDVDIFIGVAAVADYRPASAAEQKIKRNESALAAFDLPLIENPDIIASVAALPDKPLVVGFAAETNDAHEHARAKRLRKGLDAIVVNDVSDQSIGFNSINNAVTLIIDDVEVDFGKQTKLRIGQMLLTELHMHFGLSLKREA